jgi:hypothetical protein
MVLVETNANCPKSSREAKKNINGKTRIEIGYSARTEREQRRPE